MDDTWSLADELAVGVSRIGPAAARIIVGGTRRDVAGDAAVEIGRVEIDDRRVSRRHATVAMVSGRLTVTDLGSRNGTFVHRGSGETIGPLDAPLALDAGDVVTTADGIELFVVESVSAQA